MYNIQYYADCDEAKWDVFVLEKSMNGTFLQTRRFINYHQPGKFKDCSLCIKKGDELVAVLLACEIEDEGKRTFFAHKGTTFGGITISHSAYSVTAVSEMIDEILAFLKEEEFEKIYLKMVPEIYQKTNASLLDYFLKKYGFRSYDELNFYMELEKYKEDLTAPFSSSKRRDYRYSLKNQLEFKELTTKEDIAEYYQVLQKNLRKLNLPSVHSLEDLYDLYYARFPERLGFYGVYYEGTLIAGSLLFFFGEGIVHTQYLSSDEEFLKLYPMDFLITNLIRISVEKDMKIFTFGICTEDQGRYLNLGLSRFKEGFGTKYCINRSYEMELG